MTEDCRQAFEEWAKLRYLTHGYQLDRATYPDSCEGYTYRHRATDMAWVAWQGAWNRRASIPAPEVTELREAAEALLEAVIKDCGDPEKNPGDNGTVGWNGDGSEMAVTFAMMTRLQAALGRGK